MAFDDERLVADAGLLLPATLAIGLGLRQLLDTHIDLGAPGRAGVGDKAMMLIHSALAGGAGSTTVTGCALGPLAACWATGCWPLDAGDVPALGLLRPCPPARRRPVSGRALQRAWQQGAGPVDGPLTIDVDSTICPVHGTLQVGCGVPASRCVAPTRSWRSRRHLGLAARPAAWRQSLHRPQGELRAETIGRVPPAEASGPLTLPADSGFYARTVVATCQRHGVRYSIIVKLTKAVRKAIAAVPADACTPIPLLAGGRRRRGRDQLPPVQPKGPLTRLTVRQARPNPRAASSPCSASTTTTRSTLTGPARRWSWRPTTAATPRWN